MKKLNSRNVKELIVKIGNTKLKLATALVFLPHIWPCEDIWMVKHD